MLVCDSPDTLFGDTLQIPVDRGNQFTQIV